jgi:hypothetical protein
MADKKIGDQMFLPGWAWLALLILGLFNVILLLGMIALPHAPPDYTPYVWQPGEALGMHLQIFEAFLTALSIGLAVFAFVGYTAIKNAAVQKAEDVARSTTVELVKLLQPKDISTPPPNLQGFEAGGFEKREPENL